MRHAAFVPCVREAHALGARTRKRLVVFSVRVFWHEQRFGFVDVVQDDHENQRSMNIPACCEGALVPVGFADFW